MITQEMLDPKARLSATQEFVNWTAGSGYGYDSHASALPYVATSLKIYGHIVASNMEYMRTGDVDPALAAQAATTLSKLAIASETVYRADLERARPTGSFYKQAFGDALDNLQVQMANGGLIQEGALPAHFAMTPQEGVRQVGLANFRVAEAGTQVGRLLADNNYSLYFSSTTMLTGAELPETTIDDIIESDTQNKMPHLTLGNYGIGQLAGQVAKHARGRVSIFDTGSGTAATLSATIGGISEVADFDNVSILGIESNPDFSKVLRAFSLTAMHKIQGVTPDFTLAITPQPIKEMNNTFGIVEADIAEFIETLGDLPDGPEDIAMVSANFVWHRLPSPLKDRLISKFAEQKNSILAVSDLAENSSAFANRRYFNFGNNGPLNCGNIGLRQQFEEHGYKVIQIGVEEAPAFMNGKLAEALAAGANDDGHFWIAYKGDEAGRILTAA